jgi:hypothetical protein
MYKLNYSDLFLRNHLGAISFSTHFKSTCKVTSYVSIKLVNPKITCYRHNGLAKSKKLVDEKAMAAGMKEYIIWYFTRFSSSSVVAVSYAAAANP